MILNCLITIYTYMNDKTKQKEYFQSYYQKNKDKLKKRRKELYYEKGEHKKRNFRKNMTPEELELLKTRKCPDCNNILKYNNISNKQRADKINAKCYTCQGEMLSLKRRGVRLTKEERDKLKIQEQVKNVIMWKEKLRLIRIKQIKNNGSVHFPNFNKNACLYFDKLNEEKGWKLQHALNGGEIQIGGYFLDAYDAHNNIVIEYDELKHKIDKRRNKKDREKEKYIIDKLKCKFYRYLEYENKLIEIL